jgi:hypothetical protein
MLIAFDPDLWCADLGRSGFSRIFVVHGGQRIVVDAAIANVHPVYDRIAYRRAALDDPSAHHRNVVGGSATDNDLRRGSTRLVAGAGTARREPLFVPIPR